MRKILSVWIPYELTNDNKKKRVECCTEDLCLKNELGEEEWRRRYITTDETWVSFSPKPWRSDLRQWTAKDVPRPRAIQAKDRGKRTLLMIAFSYDGKFAIQETEKGEKIDSERYQKFVQYAMDKFRRERHGRIRQQDIIWRQDNARPHVSRSTMNFFETKDIQLSYQAPYSPDLNGCDRWINKHLKSCLKERTFDSLDGLLQSARQVLKDVSEDQLHREMMNFFNHCEHVIEAHGDYTVQ